MPGHALFNVLVAGSAEIPLAQLEPLLKDYVNAHEPLNVLWTPSTHANIQAVFTALNVYYEIGMAWDEINSVMLAWDDSKECQDLREEARLQGVAVLDLTNWLMPMDLEYNCV